MMAELELMIELEEEERKRKAEKLKSFDSMKEYYKSNPLDYFADKFGIKKETIDWSLIPEYENHKWDGTPNPLMEILSALVNWHWCGVESATACSKTFLAALIVYWFLDNWDDALVVTTAPKQQQLELHIWREISKLYSRFGKGEKLGLKLRMTEGHDDWVAVGFVAGTKAEKDTEEKAQGFHAAHMLIIIEETPGVPRSIINSFKLTSQAPHNLILCLGNPNHHLDNLHLFCRLERVKHIRISGLDYPNVVLKNPNFIPGGKSEQGIKDILNDVGTVDHPNYLSRVRGISPKQSMDALINIQWCYEAAERDRTKLSKGLYAMGVDVANSEAGDKAAIAFGRGAVLLELNDFPCPDSNQLGKTKVRERIKDYKIDPIRVGIDGVGVGAGTINALKEFDYQVTNIMGGDSPIDNYDDEYKFKNLRSQMWWQIREDLKYGRICLPEDEELFADLCAPNYKDNDKYIIVESKEDFKKRLGRSPNKGDAVVYWNWVRADRYNIPEADVTII